MVQTHSGSCWSFLVSPQADNCSNLYVRLSAATGAGHITAGATSCSYAANVADRRVYSMLGTFLTASGFSPAASVRA